MTLSMLRRSALAGMVALLLGAGACAETPEPETPDAQTPEPAQDDSIEALRTRANAGDAEAQHNLGLLYFNGEDVPQDVAEAILWFRKAAQQGVADAQAVLGLIYRAMRDLLDEFLTPEQVAEGQRRVREWFEAHPPE